MSDLSIIINADDLGYSKEANREIDKLAEHELITSVSVLPNGPELNDALRVIKKHPDISVGAHLNITEFASLSKSQAFKDYSLIDTSNFFTGNIKYRKHVKPIFNKSITDAIFQEWDIQISKLLEMGVFISHIDSHNMVHYWNALFPTIKKLQKKHKIKVVRMKDVKPLSFYGLFNRNLPKLTPPLLNELSNYYWNQKMRYNHPKTIIVDHVFSYKSLCDYISTGSKCPKKGVFEIIIHPGLKYMDYFEKENILVKEKYLFDLLPQHKMICFKDLL